MQSDTNTGGGKGGPEPCERRQAIKDVFLLSLLDNPECCLCKYHSTPYGVKDNKLELTTDDLVKV